MNNEKLYMHLVYYLLNKFCENSIKIPFDEWNELFDDKSFMIKHRQHNGNLEVVAIETTKQ